MIQYEYQTLYGERVSGMADHIRVRYSDSGVKVLIVDVDGWPLSSVDIVGPQSIPTQHAHETTKFSCDRFSINGKDLLS